MKLSEALNRQEKIKMLTVQLNNEIRGAVNAGMKVNVDLTEHHSLGDYQPVPLIEVTMTINPQDIE